MNTYKVKIQDSFHTTVDIDKETSASDSLNAVKQACIMHIVETGRKHPIRGMSDINDCEDISEINKYLEEKGIQVLSVHYEGTEYCLKPRTRTSTNIATYRRVPTRNLSKDVAQEVIDTEPEVVEVCKAFGTATNKTGSNDDTDLGICASGKELSVIVMGSEKFNLNHVYMDKLKEWMHWVLGSTH